MWAGSWVQGHGSCEMFFLAFVLFQFLYPCLFLVPMCWGYPRQGLQVMWREPTVCVTGLGLSPRGWLGNGLECGHRPSLVSWTLCEACLRSLKGEGVGGGVRLCFVFYSLYLGELHLKFLFLITYFFFFLK